MIAQGSRRILVADDTLPMRIMLQDVLTEAGYEVVTAGDGEEAWKIYQDEGDQLDLLIIDLLMPRMTGFEILERLKTQTLAEPKKVLVITGIFKSNKEILRLKELGASGYITKGALVDEILFRVNQVFYLGQENSRRYPRLLMSIPVEYRFRGSQFSNYTSNVSAGGAFIRTIDPAPLNEKIDVILRVPDLSQPVDAATRVVWTNEYETSRKKACLPGMGVEFITIDTSLQKLLEVFVQERLSQEPVWLD